MIMTIKRILTGAAAAAILFIMVITAGCAEKNAGQSVQAGAALPAPERGRAHNSARRPPRRAASLSSGYLTSALLPAYLAYP